MQNLLTYQQDCGNIIRMLTRQQMEEDIMQDRYKTFTIQIAKLSRFIRRIKTEEMADLGLKSIHVSCLYYLYKAGQMTAAQLCDMCEEDKAAVSRSLLFLEDEGYVACGTTTRKRYNCPLLLTAKGRATAEVINDKIASVLACSNDGISESDLEVFYRCLDRVSENLQDICKKYGD